MELKVIVPTSLSEITVDQYQRFARLEGDEEFLSKKMLDIFCGVPIENLPSVRFKDIKGVFKHLNKMLQEKPSLKQRFTLKGREFGFCPSLEEISYGEFVDLDNYLQNTQDLHKTLAVLYRPITNKVGRLYDIEPYESATKYCELMKQAPMDVALGAVVFFYHLGTELLNAMTRYLEAKEAGKISHAKPNLENAGDGTLHSINFLKETLHDLKTLENYPYTIA
jgi:hypothetical protein